VESHRFFPGKAFISTILEMLEYKTEMTAETKRRYLMRAAMAGVIVGLFYVGNYTIQAGMHSIPGIGQGEGLLAIGKLIGAAFFGFALVFIYYSKSELLTSNMMITSIGAYFHRITGRRMFRVMGLCYLGNALGGLFVGILLWGTTIISDPTMLEMEHSVHVKTGFLMEGVSGWTDLLGRAIFCNFFINLAMLMVYNGSIHDDFMKATAMVVSVFVFGYLGLEHSVANTVLFTMVGLQEGFGGADAAVPVLPALGNILICLVGNFIGGGLLIGLYYAYLNDEARFLRKHPELAPREESGQL
jgi:formate/nitrite transporter FocA (FNT family)